MQICQVFVYRAVIGLRATRRHDKMISLDMYEVELTLVVIYFDRVYCCVPLQIDDTEARWALS